jgi:hypothetical protein
MTVAKDWGESLARYQASGGSTPYIIPKVWWDTTDPDGTRRIGYTTQNQIFPNGGHYEGRTITSWTIRPDGTASWRKEGWNDGRTDLSTLTQFSRDDVSLFRMWASLASTTPLATVNDTYREFIWDHFPFTQSDRELAERTIREMQVADVFYLYYNLWTFTPPPCGGCGELILVEGITPRILEDVYHEMTEPYTYNYQSGILLAIWRIRTELRRIRNPANGEIIDGLVNPEKFPGAQCRVACSRYDVVVQVVMSVFTLGAPLWATAILQVVQAADAIRQMNDARRQAAAYREFAQSVVLGYNSALALPETVLTDRATGIGSPGQPQSSSSGGAFGAAALLLLLLLL